MSYDSDIVLGVLCRVHDFADALNMAGLSRDSGAFIITHAEAQELLKAHRAKFEFEFFPGRIRLTLDQEWTELPHPLRVECTMPPVPPRPGTFWGRAAGVALVIEDPARRMR